MLACGRPTLLVPPDYNSNRGILEILIAFDYSPQASRVIFDSLPLLKLADSVTLLRVNPQASEQRYLLDNGEEILTTLSRHGVHAELAYSKTPRDAVGEELLLIASEKGADLMVMGAYGHDRFGQNLFGGTTRTVLAEMKIPVLMSH